MDEGSFSKSVVSHHHRAWPFRILIGCCLLWSFRITSASDRNSGSCDFAEDICKYQLSSTPPTTSFKWSKIVGKSYVSVTSSNATPDEQSTRLTSPIIDSSSSTPNCYSFAYRIRGVKTTTSQQSHLLLSVSVLETRANFFNVVWSSRDLTGDTWMNVNLHLSPLLASSYELVFEASSQASTPSKWSDRVTIDLASIQPRPSDACELKANRSLPLQLSLVILL